MQLSKSYIIQKLKEVKPILLQKHHVDEIALFGSYSRNEATEKSDIDILVSLKVSSYKNLCETAYLLYDIFPNTKVQVVSKKGIKPDYFNAIKDDLIYA